MLILEDITAEISPEQTIINVEKPKYDSSTRNFIDLFPKEAYAIPDSRRRKELCDTFEEARREKKYKMYVLADTACPMRGFQGGSTHLINDRYLAVVQRDNFEWVAYTLGVPLGRSDEKTDLRDLDGEFRATVEGFEEIIMIDTTNSKRKLLLPQIEGEYSGYQKSIEQDIRDEAFRLSRFVGNFDDEQRYNAKICPLPSNSISFRVQQAYEGTNIFEAGISFIPNLASFEVLKIIRTEFPSLKNLEFVDGESVDDKYKFLFRNVHLLDLKNDSVQSYIYDKGENKIKISETYFWELRDSIVQERTKLGDKLQDHGMFIDNSLSVVLDSFGYKYHK